MQDSVDISQITDVTQLKALAYDQIADRERAEHNLQLITTRIMQLTQQPVSQGTAYSLGGAETPVAQNQQSKENRAKK